MAERLRFKLTAELHALIIHEDTQLERLRGTHVQRPHHFAIVPLIAVLIGCGAQPALDDNAGPSTQATDDSSQEQAVSSQEATEIELQMVSASDLTDQLAARKGQVVLLDMWATW